MDSSSDSAAMTSGPDVERIVTVLDKEDEVVIAGIARLIWERNDFREEVARLQERLEHTTRVLDAHHGKPLVQDNRPKLSYEEAVRIREMSRAGYRQATLAEMFDVHPATISRIVRKIYHSGVAA